MEAQTAVDDRVPVDAAPRRPWRRALFTVALAAFVGIWAFGFWYDAHRPKPEPLDSAAAHAAASVCRTALVTVSGLPQLPPGVPTVSERTARIRAENRAFAEMVAGLDAIRPIDGTGAKALTAFAADWQHLDVGRNRYLAAVLAGEKNPQLVIPVDPGGAPVTIRMGEYARIHHLNDCTPDSLQGEVVEGPRTYPHP